ncbi:MAG: IclR family transcriptional regulator [Actinobacteria bacterium]|nr:IclR family transcriptional regulator [Actinomycetota bacterium]
MASSTRSVDRTLKLLTDLADPDQGKSLSDLARASQLPPSTALRLLAALVDSGFASRDVDGGYHPGHRLIQIGAAALREDSVHEHSGPHLMEIAHDTGETANLGIQIEGERVLYLRQVASPRLIQGVGWVGRSIPMTGTAMGAALTGDVDASGYAWTEGSVEPDVVAVAAPVRGASGGIIAALSVLAPSYRTDRAKIEEIGACLVEHCRALSEGLGAIDDRKAVAA